jgi:hypothetical protein
MSDTNFNGIDDSDEFGAGCDETYGYGELFAEPADVDMTWGGTDYAAPEWTDPNVMPAAGFDAPADFVDQDGDWLDDRYAPFYDPDVVSSVVLPVGDSSPSFDFGGTPPLLEGILPASGAPADDLGAAIDFANHVIANGVDSHPALAEIGAGGIQDSIDQQFAFLHELGLEPAYEGPPVNTGIPFDPFLGGDMVELGALNPTIASLLPGGGTIDFINEQQAFVEQLAGAHGMNALGIPSFEAAMQMVTSGGGVHLANGDPILANLPFEHLSLRTLLGPLYDDVIGDDGTIVANLGIFGPEASALSNQTFPTNTAATFFERQAPTFL